MDTSPALKKIVAIMKLTTLGLILFTLNISASVYSQQTKLSLNVKNTSIKDVLYQIESTSDYRFIYEVGKINVDRKVSIHVKEKTIDYILSNVFRKGGVNYEITDHNLILINPITKKKENMIVDQMQNIQQQSKYLIGKVTDSSGVPIIGANVKVKGVSMGTVTDVNGSFSIKIPSGTVLQISYIGYLTKEVPVGTQNNVTIQLLEDNQSLDEVVVVAYGTQKKRDVIGSIASLNSSDVMKSSPTSIESALQGMASGVQVNTGDGIPGAPQQIKIRGVGSISSGTDPLWIIDGIPIQSKVMDNSIDGETNQSILSMFNPNDVESIQVLKDAAATSIYGSRGSNGVILVTTKRGKKGAVKISADIKTGFSNWEKTDIGYANNKDYISIMDKALTNVGSGTYDVSSTIRNLDGATETMTQEEALQTNTNWANVLSRTGSFYESNVSASQGTDKGNSYLSLK